MNLYSVLEPTLQQVINMISPLPEDWNARLTIIFELKQVVESVESLRGATVEPFGSFLSNLFTRRGDLDISIDLPYGSHISSAGKKRKQNLLRDLQRALIQRDEFRRLQLIPNARVPILKLESHHRNISCDISIDNMAGQMKSKFFCWINEIDGRFRDMVLLVKEWAKVYNINNPKSGTLNSYSLCLLVVFHFQTCVPAIFPPLRDIYSHNLVDELQGVRATVERNIWETCATNIARFGSDKSRKINRSSLSELFHSFIAKFCDISIKASKLGICPFTGKWELIENNTRWLPNNHALFIEDPFERPANCARAVSAKQLPRISQAFETTHLKLNSATYNQNSLLAILTRPQTSQIIPRGNYPSKNAGYPRSQKQVHRSVHSPSTVQHQTQNKRLEKHPSRPVVQQFPTQPVQRNVTELHGQPVQRYPHVQHYRGQTVQQYQAQPVRQYQSQAQQKWRPKPPGK
ncbi:protein HESO1 isoform X3 [Mangifera indica]|uniref:protein HESO1 isoform X2 n=1 Tax=Mangifera indica TaxID=29780 RepID=UPI001CFA90A9|nr:protein HESO1 isoform X2 [Mangifera indica]XP_044508520.1 protein HESO1 isoform X3 [Mangifera indica]